jgi:hypothetical protein
LKSNSFPIQDREGDQFCLFFAVLICPVVAANFNRQAAKDAEFAKNMPRLNTTSCSEGLLMLQRDSFSLGVLGVSGRLGG